MFEKLKQSLFEGVIVRKVIQKFAKHAAGAIVGLLFGPKLAAYSAPIFEAMDVSQAQIEAGLIVAFVGAFGALWNWASHRFVKKAA